MISRAARVSRICLACRTRLTQRSAVPAIRCLPIRDGLGQRRFASNFDSKDVDIDAIIAKRFSAPGVSKQKDDNEANEHDEDELEDTDWESTHLTGANRAIADEIDNFLFDLTDPTKTPSKGQGLPSASSLTDKASSDSTTNPTMNADFTFSTDILQETRFSSKHGTGSLRHPLLENQSLEVSALGEKADAIIVRNPNKMQYDKPPTREIEEKPIEESITNIDWSLVKAEAQEAEVEAESDSRDEIWNNINELRPFTKTLRMKDFEKLALSLSNGFTTDQLREYFRDHDEGPQVVEKALGDYYWVAKQIAWAPFKTIEIDNSQSKLSLVNRLISQKWKIEIQEHVDDLGQTFIWIDPHYFPFLSHGGAAFLRNARNDFLDQANNEKISTTSNECRINITSKKASTYAILERLDKYFSRVRHRMVPIKKFTKHTPTAAELKDLAKITSTSLKLHKKGSDLELQVSWIAGKAAEFSPRYQNEDKADTVLRLLTTRQTRGLVDNVESVPPLDSGNGIFVEFNRETRSRAWRDKLHTWFRFVAPVGEANDGSEPTLGLANAVSLPEYAVGEKDAQHSTTATFGHILHSEAHHSTEKLTKRRRILSAVTPHPAAFSALKPDNDEPLSQKTAIVLKFAPHVGHSQNPEKVGPSVRVNIPITSDAHVGDFQIPEETTVECAVPWNVDDVMLPGQSVDVRLTNERNLPLDIKQPGLQEYLNASHFDLLKARLKTPKDVTLSIPKQWLGPNPKSTKTSKTMKDVLYDFRGIEIHQTIEMPWQGHTFRYSLIEAGQHGGKRREITLQAGLPGTCITDFRGEQRDKFLQLVEEVATGKFFSWDEGFSLAKAQQFEDYSYELPPTEFSDEFVVSELDGQESEKKEKTKKPMGERRPRNAPLEAASDAEKQAVNSILAMVGKGPVTKQGIDRSAPPREPKADVAERRPAPDPLVEMSEAEFFKQFSSRAGDQLDQFGITPGMNAFKRRRLRRQATKRAAKEEVGEDDPFRIPTRRPTTTATTTTTTTTESAPASSADTTTEAPLSESPAAALEAAVSDGKQVDDEWDDDLGDEDFDDIEDNDMTTKEIEAELTKVLGLGPSKTNDSEHMKIWYKEVLDQKR